MSPSRPKNKRANAKSAGSALQQPSKSNSAPFQTDENSSDTDDGQDLFNRSPSPEETFSDAEGANSDGEWPVEIIGEEVDHLGSIRYEWDNWCRNTDGTNTTWDNTLVPPAIIQEWEDHRMQRRVYKAQKKFRGVEICPSIRVTDLPTLWRYEAIEERLKLHPKNSLLNGFIQAKQQTAHTSNRKQNHDAARIKHPESERVDSPQRRSSRLQSTKSPTANTSKSMDKPHSITKPGKRRRVDDSPVPESPPSHIGPSIEQVEKPVTAPKRAKVENTLKGSELSTKSHPSYWTRLQGSHEDLTDTFAAQAPPSITRRTNKGRLRTSLADGWTEIAKASGAAYITFTNEFDTEEIPRLPPDFIYIENGYAYSHDVPKASDLDESIFLRCDCRRGCNDPEHCGCQEVSDLVNEYGEKAIAYDAKGLFSIDIAPGMLVIECNQYCRCNISCRNRVSQRPRKVPIDIFKTVNRGWGARLMCSVPKGALLGIYSGKLIKRSEAEKLEGGKRGYCFDLDGQENLFENVEEQQGTYTVDAHDCGNWTRFVNHSCSPNLQVYQAVHNTIPELNTPFIIFCAKVDIPAKCELTVDYDPREIPTVKKRRKGKRKHSFEIPEGAIQCGCGEEECRRWVRVLA